ncbi:hypothetical protein Gotri_019312 [Gossypium trilobum]|uniref:DC1 domain-containing protein n=1 Tax=Gossypium trilobum TaxID=34281 RepID=A0A7J9ECF7_9ROSI|nr:hypothetical protein [Gossypium trilobum]
MESIKEDNFGEYHCDVCENERNLKHLVYYCPSWRYMAHVECDLADIQPINHNHRMSEVHPMYVIGRTISCDECRDICLGFIYLCEQCDFKLDVKCAALRTHKTAVLQEKEMARVTESQHFNHHHKLVLGYCNDPIDETKCTICELPIIGPAYFCREYNCDYILHESCLRLPQKIEVPFQWNEIPFQIHQVPFHQEHVFVSCVFPHEDSKPQCYACPFALKSLMFAYNCEHCPINLHPTCASSLRRPLKSESHGHMHDLYYFGTNFQLLIAKYLPPAASFLCVECGKRIKKEPFYRCPQCRFNFHVKCVPIPGMVKSTYHDHVLTLKVLVFEGRSKLVRSCLDSKCRALLKKQSNKREKLQVEKQKREERI